MSYSPFSRYARVFVVFVTFAALPRPSIASLVCEGAASIEAETVTITYDRDGSFRVDHLMRVRPSSHAALQFSAFEQETMSVESFRLFSIDGAERRRVQPIEDVEGAIAPAYVLVSDAKSRTLTVPAMGRSARIECVRSERHRSPLTWGAIGFDRDIPADSIRVVAIVPEGLRVGWLLSNPEGIAGPSRGTAAGETTIVWFAHSQRPRERESAPDESAERVLRIVPLRSWTKDTLLELEDWGGLGRWWSSLSAKSLEGDRRVERETAALLGDLAGAPAAAQADAPSDTAAAAALADSVYRQMQRGYRYVAVLLGIGSWQPMAAGDVIERKYGDCKGLSAAMAAMLASRGVPVRLALVRAGLESPLDPGFPSPSWFNHAIVAVPLGEKTYRFYDPTSTTTPAGRLPWSDLINPIFVADASGAELVAAPNDAAEPTRADVEVDLTIHDDFTSRSLVTLRLNGYEAQEWWHRSANERPKPGEAMRRVWLDEAMNPSATFLAAKLAFATPETIALDAEYWDASGVQRLSGDRRLVRSIGVPHGARIKMPAITNEVTAPLQFRFPFTVRCSVRLHLPAGLIPAAADSLVHIETADLRFVRYPSTERDGAWETVRELELKCRSVKSEDARRFIETWADVKRASEYAVVLGSRP